MVKRWLPVIFLAALTACQVTSASEATTPLKAYENDVRSRMNATWTRLASQNHSQLSDGKAKVRFDVAPDGRVYNFKLVSNSGNRILAEIATRTVRETRIPPIPPAVLSALPEGHMPGDCDFNVYSRTVTLDATQTKQFVLYAPKPKYPVRARREYKTGAGVFLLDVDDQKGVVASIKIEKTNGLWSLDVACLKALVKWRFKPHTLTKVRVPVRFVMR